jgi:hypothetical protein
MENKITLDRIKSIISEEIQTLLKEDYSQSDKIVKLTAEASKLLKALESFKRNVLDIKATNAASPHVDVLLKTMEKMVNNASSYIDDPKAEPKKVVFKASKPDQSVV